MYWTVAPPTRVNKDEKIKVNLPKVLPTTRYCLSDRITPSPRLQLGQVHFHYRRVQAHSGGGRQRADIARLYLQKTRLLTLDKLRDN